VHVTLSEPRTIRGVGFPEAVSHECLLRVEAV
jgi:hypothetical protein